MSLKIRGLYPATPPWLVQRLTDVIAMRRQQFYYQRYHKQNLARIPTALLEIQNTSTPVPLPKSITADSNVEMPKDVVATTKALPPLAPKATKSVSGFTTTTYRTSATELAADNGQVKEPKSIVKLAPSEIRPKENIFPNPPKDHPGKAFQCTQCFHLLPDTMRKTVPWRLAIAMIN